MDYKAMVMSCIERIPDERVDCFKKLYAIAKKENSRSRCAPTVKPDRRTREDYQDELINCIVRERLSR